MVPVDNSCLKAGGYPYFPFDGVVFSIANGGYRDVIGLWLDEALKFLIKVLFLSDLIHGGNLVD